MDQINLIFYNQLLSIVVGKNAFIQAVNLTILINN